jgi:hypothetical protein
MHFYFLVIIFSPCTLKIFLPLTLEVILVDVNEIKSIVFLFSDYDYGIFALDINENICNPFLV